MPGKQPSIQLKSTVLGLDPKTVQTFAGHSSLQVTMDRYGHLFKSEDHKRAMDTIANEVFK
jgi:integrase